jgi:phosphoserine phosphatase
MTEKSAQIEQFTGLILLTGLDAPGIAAALFETLAPFAVHVIDVEQLVINDRLVLTVLISANPAHQGAIEEDLNTCATKLDVDIATLFGKTIVPIMPQNLVVVRITSEKLRPQAIALTCQALAAAGANIQSFTRTSQTPVSIDIAVSGLTTNEVQAATSIIAFEDATRIMVKDH